MEHGRKSDDILGWRGRPKPVVSPRYLKETKEPSVISPMSLGETLSSSGISSV